MYVHPIVCLPSTLQKLYLSHNGLGDEGVLEVVDALKENRTLQHLDLADNRIGELGALALAAMLGLKIAHGRQQGGIERSGGIDRSICDRRT